MIIYLIFFIFVVLLICDLSYDIKKRKAKLKSYKELYMFFAVDKAGNEWVYYDVEPIRIEEDEEIGFDGGLSVGCGVVRRGAVA